MLNGCCFGTAVVAIWISLASLVLSLATQYWIIVNKTDIDAAAQQDTSFLYPFHQGLWMTCYDDIIPDFGTVFHFFFKLYLNRYS